jgi:hypothetical protein
MLAATKLYRGGGAGVVKGGFRGVKRGGLKSKRGGENSSFLYFIKNITISYNE